MNKAGHLSFVIRHLPWGLALLASVLLLASLKLPLWQMRLEAPQYRDQEALHVAVYPNALGGDIRELSVLEQYIGVHIPPTLPQFKWLPALLVAGAVLGVIAGLMRGIPRSRALVCVCGALTAAIVIAAIQANSQIYDIGHKRDQKTVLVGVRDFTPPFLGTRKIAQFTVSSHFGLGAWLIGGALVFQLGAALLSRQLVAAKERSAIPSESPVSESATPRPLVDSCDAVAHLIT